MESAGSSGMSANSTPDYTASHPTKQQSVNATGTSNLITVHVTSTLSTIFPLKFSKVLQPVDKTYAFGATTLIMQATYSSVAECV
jgi:hypothetical protein